MSKRAPRQDAPKADTSSEGMKSMVEYPRIYVDLKKRPKQCPNCGCDGHSYEECKVPTQQLIYEKFGARLFDTSPPAVSEKRQLLMQMTKE